MPPFLPRDSSISAFLLLAAKNGRKHRAIGALASPAVVLSFCGGSLEASPRTIVGADDPLPIRYP
jgi:hypothetical protein